MVEREGEMILSKEKINEFQEAARPLIKWLNDNCHPHVTAIVEPGSAELAEGVCRVVVEDYIKD